MEDISLGDTAFPSLSDDGGSTRPSDKSVGLSGSRIFSATLCCYTALDFDDPVLGGRQKSDGFCVNTRSCLDVSADSLGVGCLRDKQTHEICKVGGYCCSCALKTPQEAKCASVGQHLCVKSVQSFPLDPNYVKGPICACCFFQCFPTIGCMKGAPECPAQNDLVDVGGGTVTTHSVAKKVIRSYKMER